MLCATNSSPPPSPAGSEISVGAPSPPPQKIQQPSENDRRRNGDDYFRPLKRLKGILNGRERSVSPPSQRSSLEGVKSFSIADILGHSVKTETNSNDNNNSTLASSQHQTTVSRAQHFTNLSYSRKSGMSQFVCTIFYLTQFVLQK